MSVKIYVLILIGLLIYLNSLFNGFIGDDFDQIVYNENVHSIRNIPSFFAGSTYQNEGENRLTGLYYRPIMISAFSVLYAFFEQDPLPYHILQILLHSTNSILVLLVMKRFLKEKIAFVMSVIFLIHPINSETVNYVSNLQDTLFFFFGTFSFLLVIHKKFILSTFFLFLSLLSKESGVLFVAISIFYVFLFDKKRIKNFILYAGAISLLYFSIRFFVAGTNFSQTSIAPIAHATIIERLSTIPLIGAYYLKTFLYPINLVTFQFWTAKSFNVPVYIVITLITVIIFIPLILFGRALKKPAEKKVYWFFLGWFLLGILIHSQIIPLDMTVSDRWFYFPIVGLLGICAIFYSKIFKKPNILVAVLLILIIAAFSVRTVIRNFDWKDNKTLFTRDLVADKNNFYLANGVGSELIKEKKYKEARNYIENSVRLFPYEGNINNLAVLYYQEKNYKKTKELLEKSLTLGSNHTLYKNYSNFLLFHDSTQSAFTFTKEALKKYPNSKVLKKNLETLRKSL